MPHSLPVIDPRSGELAGAVTPSTSAEVAAAVGSAVGGCEEWASTTPSDRIDAVRAVADAWDQQSDALTALVLSELGQPERFTRTVHVENPLAGARQLGDLAADIAWDERMGASTIQRVPVGVVGALTPWNYPVHQVVAKVIPALLAGCTVVLKPSELAPLSVSLLVDSASRVLPPGVLTLIQGGPAVGAALVADERLDLVSFTGSTAIGREVAAAAARVGTTSVLELGGRSPAVLLDDLDDEAFTRAVRSVVADAMSNAGQTCNALSRLVVPRARRDEAVDAALTAGARFVPGGTLGPVRRALDVERLTSWLDAAEADGARVVIDGRGVEGPEGGFWFGPTVLDIDGVDAPAVRDEVFGPVLTIETYNDDGSTDERDAAAGAVARTASLGLSAAVWSAAPERAERVAAGLRAGQVRINGARWDYRLPFGGFAGAGWGREWGRAGIEAFTTTRTIVR